jgi:hypothetical protein
MNSVTAAAPPTNVMNIAETATASAAAAATGTGMDMGGMDMGGGMGPGSCRISVRQTDPKNWNHSDGSLARCCGTGTPSTHALSPTHGM